MKVIKQAFNIGIGFSKWIKHELIGDDPETTAIVNYRSKFCSGCEYSQPDHVRSTQQVVSFDKTGKRVVKTIEVNSGEKIHGFNCGLCGCVLKAKMRVKEEKCPLHDKETLGSWETRLAYLKQGAQSKEAMEDIAWTEKVLAEKFTRWDDYLTDRKKIHSQ